MGLDRVTGSLEKGKYADFIVLEGNPLTNIEILGRPSMVVSRGQIFKPRLKNKN
jgi:imidazolonepropionase-like amidohydrolase